MRWLREVLLNLMRFGVSWYGAMHDHKILRRKVYGHGILTIELYQHSKQGAGSLHIGNIWRGTLDSV